MSVDARQQGFLDELIDWMGDKSPDERHQVAVLYNWDHGDAPLLWILGQPDCDRATAFMLFWLSAPSSCLNYATEAEAEMNYAAVAYRVAHRVLDVAKAGGYTRAEIAEASLGMMSRDQWTEHAAKAGHGIILPDWLFEAQTGRVLPYADLDEGFPHHIAERLFNEEG